MLYTVIIFVLVLGILVFVHELGHFLTAKKLGVRVDEFGFGFPPRIFGIRRGETLYSINWIPLGGFVKIKGEAGDAKGDPDSFASKSALKRSGILAAGVIMNFVLAYVLLVIGFTVGIPKEIDESDIKAHSVRDIQIIIADVASDSAAEEAGIKIGDALVAIDKNSFESTEDAQRYIAEHSSERLNVDVKRGKTLLNFDVTPTMIQGQDRPVLGIGMIRAGLVKYGFFESLYRGAISTFTVTVLILIAFGQMIYGILSGAGLADQISGPVGVAVLTGQVAQLGIPYLLNFTAMLSINLGILNILPIPALDGGRILFVIIEKIKGKPVTEKIEGMIHSIGFGLLILLILFITYKDVARYGQQIMSSITNLIH